MQKNRPLKMKQVDLAKRLKVTAIHLNAVLRGRVRPSPQLALRIEEATGGAVSRMDLLYPEQKTGGQPKQ